MGATLARSEGASRQFINHPARLALVWLSNQADAKGPRAERAKRGQGEMGRPRETRHQTQLGSPGRKIGRRPVGIRGEAEAEAADRPVGKAAERAIATKCSLQRRPTPWGRAIFQARAETVRHRKWRGPSRERLSLFCSIGSGGGLAWAAWARLARQQKWWPAARLKQKAAAAAGRLAGGQRQRKGPP